MSDLLDQVREELVRHAGGYLRNPRLSPEACQRCFTPLVGGGLCVKCEQQVTNSELPDAIGFVTYATQSDPVPQSGRTMWAYKLADPPLSAKRTVQLMAALGLRGHTRCAEKLVRASVTSWATVPSLSGRTPHPLNTLVNALAAPGSREIRIHGRATEFPRDLDSSHFVVADPVPPRSHVLLVDDTWAGGGHAQSAALALREAGAERVSLLVLTRWLTIGFGDTTQAWLTKHLAADFVATMCPYTGSHCPI